MKNLLALFLLTSSLTIGVNQISYAITQDDADTTSMVEETATEQEETTVEETPVVEENRSFHQVIKQKFIEGGPSFMGIVLLCLILGLALCIERIIYLNRATTNSDALLSDIESSLSSGNVENAKEICRNTPGPVASIFYQGLDRSGEGIEVVEKSVVAYGSVQMGLLERGLSWISYSLP